MGKGIVDVRPPQEFAGGDHVGGGDCVDRNDRHRHRFLALLAGAGAIYVISKRAPGVQWQCQRLPGRVHQPREGRRFRLDPASGPSSRKELHTDEHRLDVTAAIAIVGIFALGVMALTSGGGTRDENGIQLRPSPGAKIAGYA
jgi:hypothetical protein